MLDTSGTLICALCSWEYFGCLTNLNSQQFYICSRIITSSYTGEKSNINWFPHHCPTNSWWDVLSWLSTWPDRCRNAQVCKVHFCCVYRLACGPKSEWRSCIILLAGARMEGKGQDWESLFVCTLDPGASNGFCFFFFFWDCHMWMSDSRFSNPGTWTHVRGSLGDFENSASD